MAERRLEIELRAKTQQWERDLQRAAQVVEQLSDRAAAAGLTLDQRFEREVEEADAALRKLVEAARQLKIDIPPDAARNLLALRLRLEEARNTFKQVADSATQSGSRLAAAISRNTAMFGQLSFALQDFIAVLSQPGMGLNAALRASANNFAMLAMTLGGPLTGAISAVAITAIPALIDGIRRLVTGAEDANKVLRSWKQEIEGLRRQMQEELRFERAFARAREDIEAARDLVRELRDELRVLDEEIRARQFQLGRAKERGLDEQVVEQLESGLEAAQSRRQQLARRLSIAEQAMQEAEQRRRRQAEVGRREILAREFAQALFEAAKRQAVEAGQDLFEVLRRQLDRVELGDLGDLLDREARTRGLSMPVSDLVAFELRRRLEELEAQERTDVALGRVPLRQRLRQQWEQQRQRELQQQRLAQERQKQEQERQREQQLQREVNRWLRQYAEALRRGGEVLEEVEKIVREELAAAGVDVAEAMRRLRRSAEELNRQQERMARVEELLRPRPEAERELAGAGLTVQELVRRRAARLRRLEGLGAREAMERARREVMREVGERWQRAQQQAVDAFVEDLLGFGRERGIELDAEAMRQWVMTGRIDQEQLAGLTLAERRTLFRRVAQFRRRMRGLGEAIAEGRLPVGQGLEQVLPRAAEDAANAARQVEQAQREANDVLVEHLQRQGKSLNNLAALFQQLAQRVGGLAVPDIPAPRRGNMR